MTPWYIPLIGWWAGIGGRGLFQWDLPLGIVIGIFSIHWQVEVGWPIYSRRRLWRIRQSTTTNLLFYWTWTRAKFERGTTERVLMVKPSGEVFRTGRIFSQSSLTLRSWKIQKYLLETLQAFQHWVRGCEWAGEWSVLIGLYNIFYIFDIDGMTKLMLEVNLCMSVKWDEWHVERGCESLSPLRE